MTSQEYGQHLRSRCRELRLSPNKLTRKSGIQIEYVRCYLRGRFKPSIWDRVRLDRVLQWDFRMEPLPKLLVYWRRAVRYARGVKLSYRRMLT